MKKKKANRHPRNNAKRKEERQQKAHEGIGIVAAAWNNLHYGSYASNFIIAVAILLVTPYLGYQFMNNVRGMMVGFGVGVTILFWVVWIAVILAVPVRVVGDRASDRSVSGGDGGTGGSNPSPISAVKAQNIDGFKIKGVTFLNTSPSVFDLKNMSGVEIADSKFEVAKPENEPKPMINQTGSGNVSAPNNQGNINTGPVGGNLNQTVNQFGPRQRVLAPDMKKALTEVFARFKGTKDLEINSANGDSEARNFAQEISDCRPREDNTGVGRAWWSGNPKGLNITVKDRSNIPPLATALMQAFGAGDRPPSEDPTLRDPNLVQIRVFPTDQP